MNIEEYRDYCLSLPCVEESTPFDDDVLVYKVGGKMFTAASISTFNHFAVKCDPDIAIELREQYSDITPAYHFNKKHWNDISVIGKLSDEFQREHIFASYMLVATKNITPKALRMEIIEIIKKEIE